MAKSVVTVDHLNREIKVTLNGLHYLDFDSFYELNSSAHSLEPNVRHLLDRNFNNYLLHTNLAFSYVVGRDSQGCATQINHDRIIALE